MAIVRCQGWKGLTDKETGLWSEDVDGALAETSSALPETSAVPSRLKTLRDPSASLPHKVTALQVFARMSQIRNLESGPPGEMPRILIVDDDADAANALASLLQSSGHGDARVAYTGATALALAAEFVPTVLFVDLADMSGYDLARQLSQHPQLQSLRLIALTTSSEHPGRELAREAGIERYLAKPVGSTALDELFT
jgi:CheY-like chemotaxis protein